MSSTTVVRRLRADEVERYRELRLRSLRGDPQAFGSTLARELEFTKERWQERVTSGAMSDQQATFVAEAGGGSLVGMVVILLEKTCFKIFAMWVAPSHRGQGLGGRLLDVALAWGRERSPDLPGLLQVNPKQAPAVHLYESRGFRRNGKTEPLGHIQGEVCEEMERPPPTP